MRRRTQNSITPLNVSRLAMAAAVTAVCSYQPPVLAQGLTLEEIVVTATKKDEMVQDVPSTVNVLTGDRLTEFNVFSFKDIETMTPGLSLSNVDSRNNSISMRGVSFDPDSRAAPAVVTYFNGISVRPDVAFTQMYDMERVEILRGPQGTLQGETSPAGSIQLYTKRANVDIMEGYVSQTFSDNDGSNTQFGVSLPLIEGVLGIRLAGVYDDAETGIKNHPKDDDGRSRTSSGRLSIGWMPTDTIESNLTYHYMERNADAYEMVRGNPALGQTNAPAVSYHERTTHQEGIALTDNLNKVLTWETNFEVADHLATLLLGYQDNASFSIIDQDRGNVADGYAKNQLVDTNIQTRTSEFRIQNLDGDFWEYTAGLYHNFRDSYTYNISITEVVNPGPPPTAFTARASELLIPIETENFGVFLDNKFYLSDTTTLGVGVRWQKVNIFNRTDVDLRAFGIPGLDFFPLIPAEHTTNKPETVTGGIKLTHDLNDEVMVYGSINLGYRPGGITITPDAQALPDDLVFEEEESTNFEIGFKSNLADGRYQINGAVFYQQFDNYASRAVPVYIDVNGDGSTDKTMLGGLTYNADAVIQGAELEFTGIITEGWLAFAGLSYTDGKFDGAEAPCALTNSPIGETITSGRPFNVCTSSGRLGTEPNWSISLMSEYSMPMGEYEGYVRGLYKFTDTRVNDLTNQRFGAYGLADLFVGARNDVLDVNLWVKNLFDKDALTASRGAEALGGFDSGFEQVSVTKERLIGITARYNFGL